MNLVIFFEEHDVWKAMQNLRTSSSSLDNPDSHFSLNPAQWREMVDDSQALQRALAIRISLPIWDLSNHISAIMKMGLIKEVGLVSKFLRQFRNNLR